MYCTAKRLKEGKIRLYWPNSGEMLDVEPERLHDGSWTFRHGDKVFMVELPDCWDGKEIESELTPIEPAR
jgi:hypothetical protein